MGDPALIALTLWLLPLDGGGWEGVKLSPTQSRGAAKKTKGICASCFLIFFASLAFFAVNPPRSLVPPVGVDLFLHLPYNLSLDYTSPSIAWIGLSY